MLARREIAAITLTLQRKVEARSGGPILAMQRTVCIVFVAALKADKCVAPTTNLKVLVAKGLRTLGALPLCFMGTA